MPTLTQPFATAADLGNRLGLTLSGADETRAEALLLQASRLIQDEVGQFLALVGDDAITLRGTTDERIVLPERPVVSVASVVLDGLTLAQGGDYFVDGNELVRTPALLLLDGVDVTYLRGSRGFGWESLDLVVTYTHGYDADSMPGVVQTVCLEAAARVWVNPGAVSMENVSGVAVGYAETRGMVLTDAELKTLRRFFGGRSHSMTLGD